MKNRTLYSKLMTVGLIAGVSLSLAACSGKKLETEAKYPTGADRSSTGGDIYSEPDSIFGKDGLTLFNSKEEENSTASGITVNSYLWRASLDTVSFMPLASADPFGGVILTDWYEPPESAGERFKINVFILDRELRSDAIRVKIFKQRKRGGLWRDAESSEETALKLEETILTRARKARVAQIGAIE